ncbi:MAG: hypothetical protein ACTHJ0_05760 [Flavipsychrobacter sp.]
MKKIPLIFLLLLTFLSSKAQTSINVNANIYSGCNVTIRLMAYNSSCSSLGIISNPLTIAPGGYTYTTTSPIWPTTLPPGAQIKAAIVTDPCGVDHSVGDPCTGYAATITMLCGSCYVNKSNCKWFVGGGSTTLVIEP